MLSESHIHPKGKSYTIGNIVAQIAPKSFLNGRKYTNSSMDKSLRVKYDRLVVYQWQNRLKECSYFL